ncbi:MAG TPA: SRPBCC domain-containing protein [Chitinophagales bacterium]|nr:SRPBCC domain-containing protein [Chitinophagales bacterium]
MEKKNYHISVSEKITPEEAMKHINNPKAWWGEDIDGNSEKKNDVFTYYSRDTWVKFKITELEQSKKIVWYVTDCFLHTMNDKKEWKDTRVVWEISKTKEGVKVDMTHMGLTPKMECYADCEKGWNLFVGNSLHTLMTTGKGTPHKGKTRIK